MTLTESMLLWLFMLYNAGDFQTRARMSNGGEYLFWPSVLAAAFGGLVGVGEFFALRWLYGALHD